MQRSGGFQVVKDFVQTFTDQTAMSSQLVRQAFLNFGGPDQLGFSVNSTIGTFVNFSNPVSESQVDFKVALSNSSGVGGSTNTPVAVDFARSDILTSDTVRPGFKRIVVLMTDGFPTNATGHNTDGTATEQAVQDMIMEDNVTFVFVQFVGGQAYPPQWFDGTAHVVYETTIATLPTLAPTFLCQLSSDSPTSSPTPLAPSTSPLTSAPSQAPSDSPETGSSTASPGSPPDSSASNSPSQSPVPAPTQSPSCNTGPADIIWVLDGSSSILYNQGAFNAMKGIMTNFTTSQTLGPNDIRQGFIVFAGPGTLDPAWTTIGLNLNLTDPAAVDNGQFISQVSSLSEPGGSSNQAGALHFVREYMLTNGNDRGVPRYVILMTDGEATDNQGAEVDKIVVENAAQALIDEDDPFFVFLQFGAPNNYPSGYFSNLTKSVTYSTSFEMATSVLSDGFLCVTNSPTNMPSLFPTNTNHPSFSPTTTSSPTSSPTESPTILK